MLQVTPVLMVGGAGTRLWPVSTASKPKQFHPLTGPETLFQKTLSLVSGKHDKVSFAPPIIIGAERYRDLIEEQITSIGISVEEIILEPEAKNTAAVAAIAAQAVKQIGGDLALLLPSDSNIGAPDKFREAVSDATEIAVQGWITTFGIQPDRPETGYGYIKAGERLGLNAYKIEQFVEKPNSGTAKTYLDKGDYTWNAGIFYFSPDAMMMEMQRHAPNIFQAASEAYKKATRKGQNKILDANIFSQCQAISVDYAVMEKTDRAAIFGPVSCNWSDVGSWRTLAALNASRSPSNVTFVDSNGCYAHTDGSVFLATIGLKDIIVVAHEGNVLVLPKDRSQDVKTLIQAFKDTEKDHLL